MKEVIDKNFLLYTPIDTRVLVSGEIARKVFVEEKKGKKIERSFKYFSLSPYAKNPALIFNKLIPHSFEKKTGGEVIKKDNKKAYLDIVIDEMSKIEEEIYYMSRRIENSINGLKNSGYKVFKFKALPLWRLVVGLGAIHPQETSMTLHHIYGFPYIPGSAIKGVTRHWAILRLTEEYIEDRKRKGEGLEFSEALKIILKILNEGEDQADMADNSDFRDFKEIFGTEDRMGNVIFFDAYPHRKINLKVDLTNSHYPEYYLDNKAPSDWQQPRPVFFLVVENTEFVFYIASKDENLGFKALEWAKKALKEHGVGAKTSVGYGLFDFVL